MSCNREELVKLYLKSKDPSLRDPIVESYQSLVEYIARKFAYNPDDVKDLTQVGSIGLLKALDGYDADRNTSYATYASSVIIGEIRHYIRDKLKLVKLPRRIQEQHSSIRNYIKEKTQELNRFPTPYEIAVGLNLSEEDVLESMEAVNQISVISLDKPIQNNNKFINERYSLIDNIYSDEVDQDNYLNKEMLVSAIEELEEREKRIIYLRFFEGLTQKQISDSLNISQVHVSRIIASSLKKLKSTISSNQ